MNEISFYSRHFAAPGTPAVYPKEFVIFSFLGVNFLTPKNAHHLANEDVLRHQSKRTQIPRKLLNLIMFLVWR